MNDVCWLILIQAPDNYTPYIHTRPVPYTEARKQIAALIKMGVPAKNMEVFQEQPSILVDRGEWEI